MTTASPPESRAFDRLASLSVVVAVAFWLRVAAAVAVQWAADRRGTLCLFPDTDTYWALAETIRRGTTYVIFYDTQPHYALRTPGYPLFLAACRWAFGDRGLPARLVQAVLGAVSVAMVERLTRRAVPGDRPVRGRWTVPLAAAALAAVEPYTVFTSALLLSEAVFLPLMMAGQWCLAEAWADGERARPRRRAWAWALGMGLASGAAVLVRPSWALFVPATLAAWIALAGRGRRLDAARLAAVAALGAALVMAPWWARNARIYGRFVPTALWAGASLYDGLNPRATGASDMDFLNDPDIYPLGEQEQDALLARARRGLRPLPSGPDDLAGGGEVRAVLDPLAQRRRVPLPDRRGAERLGDAPAVRPDGGRALRPSPRPARLDAPGRAPPLYLRPARGLRRLDALPDRQRGARLRARGDRPAVADGSVATPAPGLDRG